jgi:DNA-binding LytR/AlgR family response regulator
MKFTLNTLKLIIIWLAINTSIGLIIFAIQSVNSSLSIWVIFWSSMITAHIVSSSCALTGFYLQKRLDNLTSKIRLSLIFCGSLTASIIATFISFFITRYLLLYPELSFTFDSFIKRLIIVIIITAAVTIITIRIELLKRTQYRLEKDLDIIKDEIKRFPEKQIFSVKEDDVYHIIEQDDLIYLSSHGKKTILHTIKKDYETSQLLKNIEKSLSNSFIRIHKQFIINTKFLSQIKYYEGGRYMAYLKDEDESTLPVGRKIAPLLKEKFGI